MRVDKRIILFISASFAITMLSSVDTNAASAVKLKKTSTSLEYNVWHRMEK